MANATNVTAGYGGIIPTTDFMSDYPEPGRKFILNITILITLVTGGFLPTDLGRTGAALELAIGRVRTEILPRVYVNYHINSKHGMTLCPDEENHSTFLITKFAYEVAGMNGVPRVGLLAGPCCADMDIPHVNSGATADDFDDRRVFKTLIRMAYTMNTLDRFSLSILDFLNYTHIAIIYDEIIPWPQVTGQVFYRVMYYRKDIKMYPLSLPYKTKDNVDSAFRERMLTDAAKEARVILILATAPVVRQWMLSAYSMNMCNGDFLFITYEWFRSPYFGPGEYSWKYYNDDDQTAKEAYRVLFRIATDEKFSDPNFQKWSKKVKLIAKERFGYEYGVNETVSPAATGLHDGVILYAHALNDTIAAGEDPFNGTRISQRMCNRQIRGAEGVVKTTSIGVKDESYIFTQSNDNGTWNTIMRYTWTLGRLETNVQPIVWIKGKQLPEDVPKCGFLNEKLECRQKGDNTASITAVIVALLALTTVGLFGYIRFKKQKFELALQDEWWRVLAEHVRTGNRAESHTSMKSQLSLGKKSIYSGTGTGSAQLLASKSVGKYHGKVVFIRIIGQRVLVTRQFRLHMSKLRSMIHDNLNRLVGICVEPNNEAIYTEFCIKGSIADLMQNESINLDWSLRFSLIADLVTGMEFLHNSFLHSHGYLNSSNCVIDGRFTLKVADFHLPKYRPQPLPITIASPEFEQEFECKPFLYRAPEHLRVQMPQAGTQKGDSYSCGIVLQEISARAEPYQNADLSYPQILLRIIQYEIPPMRPKIATEQVPTEVLEVIEQCLMESPDERPSFKEIKAILRKSKFMKEGNVMENMLKRMEKYAQELEGVVADRTEAFFDEKRKAEELLYQVMPKEIADTLKIGGLVPPEAFECVTVYFSDIVGFVELAAESTPFEIVEFLNDVYIELDAAVVEFDVYKVETISDTYMVASGLPNRNGNRHADEISRMALHFLGIAMSFKVKHRPGMRLNLRIGINSGPCAAGVVGLKMPRYCLFGDSVNTASRMESTGKALRIQMSEATKRILDDFHNFITELRGEIEVKGKGKHITYWLLGMTPDDSKSRGQ